MLQMTKYNIYIVFTIIVNYNYEILSFLVRSLVKKKVIKSKAEVGKLGPASFMWSIKGKSAVCDHIFILNRMRSTEMLPTNPGHANVTREYKTRNTRYSEV